MDNFRELSVPGGIVLGMAVTPRATDPNDLGKFFVTRANAGDVEGALATGHEQIAHRQPDGYWLWAVDQPAFIP